MKTLYFIALALIITGLYSPAHAAVWTDTNKWDAATELQYSQWVHDNVDEYIFIKDGSLLKGIATDCADAVYAVRALFAYQNKLPFVATSTASTPAKHVYVSNRTTHFDNIKDPNARFQAFVRAVSGTTSTTSLEWDTYPVSIDRDHVRPGTVMLYNHTNSLFVHDVTPEGILELLSSTRPIAARKLDVRTEITKPPYGTTDQPFDGLRNWRHIELGSSDVLDGYSTDQFAITKSPPQAWGHKTEHMLATADPFPSEHVNRIAENICSAIRKRVDVVQEGLKHRPANRCMTREEFQNYSTQWHDDGIRVRFQSLDAFINQYRGDDQSMAELGAERDQLLAACDVHFDSLDSNNFMTATEFRERLTAGQIPMDPNLDNSIRWGVPGATSQRPACTQYPALNQ